MSIFIHFNFSSESLSNEKLSNHDFKAYKKHRLQMVKWSFLVFVRWPHKTTGLPSSIHENGILITNGLSNLLLLLLFFIVRFILSNQLIDILVHNNSHIIQWRQKLFNLNCNLCPNDDFVLNRINQIIMKDPICHLIISDYSKCTGQEMKEKKKEAKTTYTKRPKPEKHVRII